MNEEEEEEKEKREEKEREISSSQLAPSEITNDFSSHLFAHGV